MKAELRNEYEKRMDAAVSEAVKRGFSALIVYGVAPRRVGDLMYLTGHQPMLPGHPRRYSFKGRGASAIIMPIEGKPCLITTTPFIEKELFIEDVTYVDDLPAEIAQRITKYGLSHADIGIVGTDILGVSLYFDLCKELSQARFRPADDVIMNLRAQKSEYELSIIRSGAEIADEVADLLRNFLRPGLTEWDVYTFITGELMKRGVSNAFATCQSGVRSETPYEIQFATNKVIESGDMVHMEINGKIEGYMIDVCRSTVVGTASEEQLRILNTVHEMFLKGAEAMIPGVTAESIEAVTGNIAYQNGFYHNHTKHFGGDATLAGHAIGFGVDEPPVLAYGDKTRLADGMVITLEPGLYHTGAGGCRLEDELLVTKEGVVDFNHNDMVWW